MRRRDWLKCAAALPALQSAADAQRLDQGPFGIEQDEGWRTILFTTPSEEPLRNPGLGLVGYAWEESGPSLAARAGKETLAQHVERLSALPFVDILYIRCDWRNVQKQAGKLDLDPVWQLCFDAARERELRVAFRVQLSSPNFEPKEIALPHFLRDRIPLVRISPEYVEPRYDHLAFQSAFNELNELLAARFDGDPLLEWVDLMQYGFWGEGHTSNYPNPIGDFASAERTFVAMTERQIHTWRKTPLAVNTQPDISGVGNRRVIDLAVKAGCWMRSDSIVVEEPIQIDQLANRPPWLAAILEDGYFRQYDVDALKQDERGVNEMENYMLHTLDVRANYWSLWTESANLLRYNARYPRGFARLRSSLGYRIRPAWVWQRKRHDTSELVIGLANRGVSGVPGTLWLEVRSPDRQWAVRGSLDPGQPYGGGIAEASILLPKGFSGRATLSASLEIRPGVVRPVAWACEQARQPDGSLALDIKSWNEPGWRKNV